MKEKSTILSYFKSLKTSLIKNLPSILGIAIILYSISEFISENNRLHEKLIGKDEEIKLLNNNVANLKREYVEQQQLQDTFKKEWNVERSNLRGRIKVLSNATYLIRERARREGASDLSYQGKKVKYVFNELRFREGPPIGYVLIFDNGRVVSKIYNHQIDVKTAISRDEEQGTYDVLSKADFILRSGHLKPDGKNWFNVRYPLAITGGTAKIDPTEKLNTSKSFYWDKQLNANINFTSRPMPGLGLSFAGYGKSKRDLDFKFLQLGAQYDDSQVGLTATPVLWRFAPNLLNNTYIGPGYYADKNNNGWFVGLQIGL